MHNVTYRSNGKNIPSPLDASKAVVLVVDIVDTVEVISCLLCSSSIGSVGEHDG